MNKRSLALAGLLSTTVTCGVPDPAVTTSPDVVEVKSALDQGFKDMVKHIASQADTYVSYFSKAASAYDVAQKLGALLGLWSSTDLSQQMKQLTDVVNADARALDWKLTVEWIDANRNMVTGAASRLARTGAATELDDRDSYNGVMNLTSDVGFYRVYDEVVTDGQWKTAISDRAPVTRGSAGAIVYDWSLGVPALMQAISYRLAVITALDPSFRWDSAFDTSDLVPLRNALKANYDMMVQGIRCASATYANAPGHYCADIYTGNYTFAPFGGGEQPSWEVTRARLASGLRQSMPLYEMRAMIDLLNLYIGGGKDLTEVYAQIPFGGAPKLCLDAGSGAAQALVQVNSCNRSATQTWTYDRASGAIVNAYGWCLDVQNADVMVQTGPQPVWGNPASWPLVWTYWCNQTNAQKWTYDPDSRVLQNALGTALDIQSGNLAVQARPVDGTAPQQWWADRPFSDQPTGASTCGRLNPGERLGMGQSALSCGGGYRLSLGSDGNVSLDSKQSVFFGLWGRRWNTTLSGVTSDILSMQGDGNLVLYNMTGAPIWSSNTWGNPGAYLAIQDNGEMVIFDANGARLWAVTPQKKYKEHRAPPSVLWQNPTTGELSAWVLDEFAKVSDHRTLSWGCDTASGCASSWKVIGTADLNADGNTDVLWQNPATGELSTWLLNPSGVVTGSQSLSWRCDAACLASWRPVGLLDLNHDLKSDLLWHNASSGEVGAWLLDTNGTVLGSQSLSPRCDQNGCSQAWKAVTTMDINSDGNADLLWHNAGAGALSGWLLNGDVIGYASLSAQCDNQSRCASTWKVVGSGDFNGDGNDDLLWYNTLTGDIGAWVTDGAGTVTGTQFLSMRCDPIAINAIYGTLSGCLQAWQPVGLINVR